jgi:hypothetical protein
MVAEAVPQSVNWDDNLRIAFVAEADNPLSVADITTGDDLTYSLKTFNLTETQAVVDDPRLTLKQVLQRPGKTTVTCEVNYVFGDTGDVAAVTLAEGTKGHLTVRYSVPNATDWAAAQIVDVITFVAGSQRKDAPVENGVQTITQTLFVTGVVQKDQALIA